MDEDKCKFCINRWTCKEVCNKCNLTNCEHNRDGFCLDIKVLKRSGKQTGCIYYDNKNLNKSEEAKG